MPLPANFIARKCSEPSFFFRESVFVDIMIFCLSGTSLESHDSQLLSLSNISLGDPAPTKPLTLPPLEPVFHSGKPSLKVR
jgi:hypothetical protein